MKKRFKIPSDTFQLILKKAKEDCCLVTGENFDLNKRVKPSDNIYYDTANKCIQMEFGDYCFTTNNWDTDKCNYWEQIVLLDGGNDQAEEIRTTPYANQATAAVEAILHKHYTDEDIEEIFKAHAVKEEDRVKPRHQILTNSINYDFNTLYRFDDVYYYDINKAHRDALMEMFPKCKRLFENLKTKWDKDCINIYVGNLGHKYKDGYRYTRETYNWIVKRTRDILDNLIDFCDGEVIYANTDGVMIRDPLNTIKTSNKIGEFSNEMTGHTVYFYYQLKDKEKNIPQYYLYQYTDKDGNKTKKGTLRRNLRDKIDLEEGKLICMYTGEN